MRRTDKMIREETEGTMGTFADRIAAVFSTVRGLAPVILLAGCVGLAAAQTTPQASDTTPPPAKPAAPTTFTGCVQKAPGYPATLVISGPTVCARLTGKVSAEKLAGHEIELQGVLIPRTTSVAASIQVESVTKVGEACSGVCSLQPPGSRGLHPGDKNHEVPGSEGGTPE